MVIALNLKMDNREAGHPMNFDPLQGGSRLKVPHRGRGGRGGCHEKLGDLMMSCQRLIKHTRVYFIV
jgi:hypothetical protein